jgi:GAF domain-containing protein
VFTDPASPEIDQAQYASGTGPCLDAFRDGVPYAVVDTENEPRWPAFAAQALAHGIRSTLSIPLTLDEASLGALNLYSKIAGSFSAADREVAEQFATQAAAVLTTAQAYWSAQKLSVQLRQAMDSRETIDQAVGMLMAEHQCGPVEALEMLRQRSQDENRKVRDLAHELVTRFEG